MSASGVIPDLPTLPQCGAVKPTPTDADAGRWRCELPKGHHGYHLVTVYWGPFQTERPTNGC